MSCGEPARVQQPPQFGPSGTVRSKSSDARTVVWLLTRTVAVLCAVRPVVSVATARTVRVPSNVALVFHWTDQPPAPLASTPRLELPTKNLSFVTPAAAVAVA
jgi:hypothetical protein